MLDEKVINDINREIGALKADGENLKGWLTRFEGKIDKKLDDIALAISNSVGQGQFRQHQDSCEKKFKDVESIFDTKLKAYEANNEKKFIALDIRVDGMIPKWLAFVTSMVAAILGAVGGAFSSKLIGG